MTLVSAHSHPQPEAASLLLLDSIDLPFLDFSCRWNYKIASLVCLASFTPQNAFVIPSLAVCVTPSSFPLNWVPWGDGLRLPYALTPA